MDAYTCIVVIFCIALFAINLVFACFTCFSILHSCVTEANKDLSDLKKYLIEREEGKPDDEKVIIIAVPSNKGFSDSVDGDDCGGQDCSQGICTC
ncbi:unnamed protein product [Brassica oleracea]|uniref:Uncharacterized protein n=2 Tax=Brassica oleracea TaxID=3712 RepID=A0A0D3DPY1_BRAOL|nr:PREDICTED: uncharacterized protein LOC106310771 [Brassica oleracea var. oleracea]VDD56167.1 unnamed protein product [Brassica oleracea]